MAWRIFFNNQDFGAVNDETYETIFASIKTAAQNGDVAEFGTEVGGVKRTGIWTEGAPISFEYFDETAAD